MSNIIESYNKIKSNIIKINNNSKAKIIAVSKTFSLGHNKQLKFVFIKSEITSGIRGRLA